VSRLYPERLRSLLGQGSNTATWLIVRDVGQRAVHDVRALSRTISAFIAERTHRLSALLTGDVPPRHLLCPVHSTGRRRACLVRCQNSAPVLRSALYSSLVREATPAHRDYTRSRVSGRKKMAPAEDISGYLRYVPGPTCQGSALLYMSPFSYKRGGMQRYNGSSIWRLRPSSFHSNPTHSGVGCYASVARTTLNSRMFMCLMFA
jgi:hypothetical protein